MTVFTSSLLVGAISLATANPAAVARSAASPATAPARLSQSSSILIATAYTNNTLPTLRRGSQGESVRMLREILISNGFLGAAVSRLGVDSSYPANVSSFDWVMEDAIKDLQRRYNLQADGIVGPTTWEVLDREENPYRAPLPWIQANNPVPDRPTPPGSGQFREAFVSVRVGTLNVRREPWGPIVNSLPNGARVLVTGNRQGDWVQLDNGNWLREQYIRYGDRTN